nr:PREDICTED: uncharacterized protein C12orf45 homolog [Latimeria chalumnae]|eukprot:XP_006004193.1 PREDICTED: uncharacterized protein C12orf45 homolog [Latimeria chalumnae]
MTGSFRPAVSLARLLLQLCVTSDCTLLLACLRPYLAAMEEFPRLEGSKPATTRSTELLSVGEGGDICSKFLINNKHSSKNDRTLQTTKMPRSSILDRVQGFLPQMARANEELLRQMETLPASQFNIEDVEENPERIIEMPARRCQLFRGRRESLRSADVPPGTAPVLCPFRNAARTCHGDEL